MIRGATTFDDEQLLDFLLLFMFFHHVSRCVLSSAWSFGAPFCGVCFCGVLLYIPMSFLLLNDTNDLLFRTVNELQDSQNMHCGAFHVNWEIPQFLLASLFWSVLCHLFAQFWLHYTGWIDVLVCVSVFRKSRTRLSVSCVPDWPVVSSSQVFPFGELLESTCHRTLFALEGSLA